MFLLNAPNKSMNTKMPSKGKIMPKCLRKENEYSTAFKKKINTKCLQRENRY